MYNEVKRLKENVQEEPHPSESVQEEPQPSSEASSESELENSFDIDEGVDLDKTNDCDEEIQKLFSGKNVSLMSINLLCKTIVIALKKNVEVYFCSFLSFIMNYKLLETVRKWFKVLKLYTSGF